MSTNIRFMPLLAGILFGLQLLCCSTVVAEEKSFSAMSSSKNIAELMKTTPQQGKFVLRSMNLEGMPTQDLELKRFTVFSDDLQVWLGNTRSNIRPNNTYFKGAVKGTPNSKVVLTVYADQKMRGFVFADKKIWLLTRQKGELLSNRKISTDELKALGPDTDKLNLNDEVYPPSNPSTSNTPSIDALPAYAYTARIAIETDSEYLDLFSGNQSAALNYIGDLFAYASTIYETEVNTHLMAHWVRLWPASGGADPWSSSTSNGILNELQTYWNNPANWASGTEPTRSLTHMLSGKSTGGGIAYVGVLCNANWGYGMIGDISADFDISNPAVIWDIVSFTHEIGHNFNSPHSHNYCGPTGNDQPIDNCVVSDAWDSNYNIGCQAPNAANGLPINNITGFQAASGQGAGTIMSYCHQISGDFGNISMTFGRPNGTTPFTWGLNPERQVDQMRTHVAANTACLTPYYLLEITPPTNGSISSDVGTISCDTDCSDNYIVNTAVTLTATPDTGYELANWSGVCTGSGSCVVTMSEAQTVSATFQLSTTVNYVLNVSISGNGTVSSSPAGINCGLDCTESYVENTVVDLTATPNTGETFTQWGGACSGSGACQVTMSSAKNVTATFVTNAIIPGDSTGDGLVNVLDIVHILNHIADGTGVGTGADCNADGSVNVLDIVCTINTILN